MKTMLAEKVRQIAKQYESEGYTVLVEPRDDQVPPFVAGLGLDMIAFRGEEKVVVEVRATRSDLARSPRVARLAEAVNSQPGWRFDLVVLEQESPLERAVGTASEPSDEQLRGMFDRARKAMSVGLLDMAAVHAWAALEAVMRRMSGSERYFSRSRDLLASLYSQGFLNRVEFERAREASTIRNQAVHGFVTSEIDPGLIEDTLALAQKLMSHAENAAPATG
jgi:hypothetical protein